MIFKDKHVLITGATRGIGRATSLAFANARAKVGLNYKTNDTAAKETSKQLYGIGHTLFKVDLSKPNGPEKLVGDFINVYGSIDILINNAGISIDHDINNTNKTDWKRAWLEIMAMNVHAPANLCFHAAKSMMNTGGGRIINVSSRGAYRGEPTKPAYGASKAALNSLTQSLAKALAPHKIYVAGVAPGFTDTEMAAKTLTPIERDRLLAESPFKRMAKPEEVAHAILFLASAGAEYSAGTIIDVNGASYLR
ncbi:MAG: SDR family oxidoreductase [Fulvivirga sp.]|uniref:SDR family NAD(P)-dependent oxidoreductase n=1 Tax=Fulvivirga sp. TaxID=1931237 RepID=UPI0032EBB1F5